MINVNHSPQLTKVYYIIIKLARVESKNISCTYLHPYPVTYTI